MDEINDPDYPTTEDFEAAWARGEYLSVNIPGPEIGPRAKWPGPYIPAEKE